MRKDLESWIRGDVTQGGEAVIDAFSLRFPVAFFSRDASTEIKTEEIKTEEVKAETKAEPYEENAEPLNTAEETYAENLPVENLPKDNEDNIEAEEQIVVEEQVIVSEREPDDNEFNNRESGDHESSDNEMNGRKMEDHKPSDREMPDESETNESREILGEEDEKRPAWKILQETMRVKRQNTGQIYTAHKRRGFREDRVRFIAVCLFAIILIGTVIALYRNIQRGTYDAMMTRAQDLFAQQQYAAALDAFNETSRRHPDRIEPLLGVAHSAERAGRINDAIAAYRLSLERFSAGTAHLRSQTFYEIGRLYTALTEWGNAQESFESAITADVTNFNAHFSLGNALEEQSKLDEALLIYQQALNLSPSSNAAREAINRVNLAMSDREEAERLALLELRFQQAAQYGRAALEDERFREASDYFAEALAIRSDDASAWVGFGEARFRLGDTAGAVTSMQRALERDPEYELARSRLAEIEAYIAEQNRSAAPQRRRNQRQASRTLARDSAIIPVATPAVTADTLSRAALFDRGVELFRRGEYEASFNYFVASMRSPEKELLPSASLAGFAGPARPVWKGFQTRLNVPSEARLLAEAVRLNPLDRDLYVNLAMAATRMGLDRQAVYSTLSEAHSHALMRASSQ